MKNIILSCLILTGFMMLTPRPSYALRYDLVPPSGDLQRGQEIQFTININTESTAVSSTQIGMTYDTQYLQYISTVPGDAMTNVSVSQLETGKLLFSGSNTSGYTGSGVFAYVNFKIIAGSPGETELCVLWAPSPTTAPAQATSAPVPTALPRTGNIERTTVGGTIGVVLLIGALLFYVFFNRHRYRIIRSRKKLPSQPKRQ